MFSWLFPSSGSENGDSLEEQEDSEESEHQEPSQRSEPEPGEAEDTVDDSDVFLGTSADDSERSADSVDDTALIEGVPPSGFLDREAELLELAYEHLPTIPFDEVDVLVVDRMGKDVSGAGMDTNVIGRIVFGFEPDPPEPDITRIFVRGLTPASHGNGTGLGSADFVHAHLFEELNWSDTLVNVLTASTPRAARIPPAVETDRTGLIASLSTIGVKALEAPRVVRIRDTMRLSRVAASAPLIEEARDRDDLRVVEEPAPVEFEDGQFVEDVLEPSDH